MAERAKDNSFCHKFLLNCRGRLLDLSTPAVMGILNVTPDSFFDGGRHNAPEQAIEHGLNLSKDGALMIDVGGCSTRPGSVYPGTDEELERVIPVISGLLKNDPELIISIDTYHPLVAKEAVKAGASIINDVSGGMIYPEMDRTVAELHVPYVLMHMQGTPQNMQDNPEYGDVVKEVLTFLIQQSTALRARGIADIIIDPGFGFGKDLVHNYRLLNNLWRFTRTGFPVLTGFSRKRMVNRVLGSTPQEGLSGTTALHVMALQQGVNILRVHDVKEAVAAVRIFNFARNTL